MLLLKKYSQVCMIILFLFPALLTSMPDVAAADCGPPPNDGFGTAKYPAYAAWCIQCGGRPYNDRGVGCDMSSASTGSGGSTYKTPAVGGMQGAVLKGIQQGIQQGIQNAIQQQKQNEAEQQQRQQMENDRASQQMFQDSAQIEKDSRDKARLLEEKNRIANLKARQTDAQRTDEILSQMQGGSDVNPGSQGPKDLSERPNSDEGNCTGKEDFSDYRKRAAERREILGKLAVYAKNNPSMKERADWCKMHIPLPPSPYSSQYCRQKPIYESKMTEWRKKCDLAVGAPASQ